MIESQESRARFWSLVEKADPFQCWLWIGFIHQQGYGQLNRRGTTLWAHRFAWAITNGVIPKGMSVLHTCDVRNCVNPAHLFLGTLDDNMKDMVRKGRQNRRWGAGNSNARLSEEQVIQMRTRMDAGESIRSIATEFGVAWNTAWCIKARTRWQRLDAVRPGWRTE